MDSGSFSGLDAGSIVCDEHLPDGIRAAAERAGVPIVRPVLDAHTLVRMSGSDDGACGCVSPDDLEPIYAREPDAVTQWRARHG